MNQVNLVGRVTKDIELKKTNSGKSVAQFTLAIRRDKDNADYVPCIAWEKRAELLSQYVKKGNRIGVSGKIQTRSYESNGRKNYITEVLANEIEFLENKKQETKPEPQNDEHYVNQDLWQNANEISDDDLPF